MKTLKYFFIRSINANGMYICSLTWPGSFLEATVYYEDKWSLFGGYLVLLNQINWGLLKYGLYLQGALYSEVVFNTGKTVCLKSKVCFYCHLCSERIGESNAVNALTITWISHAISMLIYQGPSFYLKYLVKKD